MILETNSADIISPPKKICLKFFNSFLKPEYSIYWLILDGVPELMVSGFSLLINNVNSLMSLTVSSSANTIFAPRVSGNKSIMNGSNETEVIERDFLIFEKFS